MKTAYLLVHYYTSMSGTKVQSIIGGYTTAEKRKIVRNELVKTIAYPEDLEDVDIEVEGE